MIKKNYIRSSKENYIYLPLLYTHNTPIGEDDQAKLMMIIMILLYYLQTFRAKDERTIKLEGIETEEEENETKNYCDKQQLEVILITLIFTISPLN